MLTTREHDGGGAEKPMRRRLGRDTALNLVGQCAPVAAAVLTIPPLMAALGTERFAILTIAWAVIGYFSLFDLGISRALTQLVADRLAAGDREQMPALIWTSLALMGALGVLGGSLLAVGAPWVVREALNIPVELQTETLRTFYLLALGLPLVIGMNGLRGVLEGYQRFDVLTLIRVPTGVMAYVGPLFMAFLIVDLFAVVAVLVALRAVSLLVHLWFCVRMAPELRAGIVLRPSLAAPLVRIGGWMTVSNVVSPLMVYADRFMIGALFPVAAVAYYVTPYEAITKLLLIPGALAGVCFPALAASYGGNRRHAVEILLWGSRLAWFLVLPFSVVTVTFAHEILSIWLGVAFAVEGAGVLRWLAVGVFVNGLAHIAYSAVQGAGRADLTAKLHLLEMPVYVLVLWWLVSSHGVTGAAAAWTLRVSVDAFLLFRSAGRLFDAPEAVSRTVGTMSVLALLLFGIGAGTVVMGLEAKLVFVGLTLTLWLVLGWMHGLRPTQRSRIMAVINRREVRAS